MGDFLSAEVQAWRREGASGENKVVRIAGVGHSIDIGHSDISFYGNGLPAFKISERLRIIEICGSRVDVITSVTIFVVISSTSRT